MSDENVPMDATAMQAEAIVKAAIAWRLRQETDPIMNLEEFRLYEACKEYGDQFKGVHRR